MKFVWNGKETRMLKLLKYLSKKDRFYAFLCLLLVAGQVWFDLTMPDFMSDITRLIVTPGSAMKDVWIAGGKMLACAFSSAALSVIVGWFAARIASDYSYTVREAVFSKVTDFGMEEMKRFSTPSLITRTTNDITQIQMVVAFGLQMIIKAPIMAVWAILKIVGKNWQLSLVTAVAVVAILALIITVMATVIPKFKIVQKQIDDVNRVTRENLTGLRIIRAFNAEQYQEEKFETHNDALMKTMLFTSRRMALQMPFISMIMSGISLAIYWLGAALIEQIGIATPIALAERVELFSEIVVFSSYAMYVVMSFMTLVMVFMMFPRAQVSATRINEVLHTDPSILEGEGAEGDECGTVEFDHVSFRYKDAAEDCLKNISFRADSGETIAFIGSTGSGKTTLVSLAARLYDATEGTVRIDGKDIKEYSFSELYNKVGYIAQKAFLFSGSVQENMTFGETEKGITEEDWRTALDIAQAEDFVNAMPAGAESDIAQGGKNLSGGQKQRLSIARTIARHPEILIFDDSFSALDYATDAALRKRLATDLAGTTCLIVAQRIGTVRNADKIVVLDEGQIVGIGTHTELLRECGVYREIALSQLSESELEVS